MSDEQTNFKVTDRRLFNADGSPREVPAEEKPESDSTVSAEATSAASAASAEPGPRPSAASGPSDAASTAQPQTETAQAQTEERQTSSTPSDDDELDAENPAAFVNFIMSIASNAASSLGMMEHPVTHKREVDLELAKHWIDILGMLELKTQGNLHPQEERILEGLLSDLRMQYVSLANTASPKAAGAYTGRDIIGG